MGAKGNPNWVKGGKSPNPGGRPSDPRIAKVKEAALASCQKAIKTLVELLDDECPNIRCKAAEALLDRGIGRPTQLVGEDAEHPFGEYRDMTTDQLKALLAQQMAAK